MVPLRRAPSAPARGTQAGSAAPAALGAQYANSLNSGSTLPFQAVR